MTRFQTELREDGLYEVKHALMGVNPLTFQNKEQAELLRIALGQAYYEGAEDARAAIRSALGVAKDR